MKKIIKTEEAAMSLAALYMLSFHSLGFPVWVWGLLFFSPDISMLGYLINTRDGALCYNLFHNKAIAICLAFVGYIVASEALVAAGLLLFAHSSFDRMLGYGLKYETGFKDTHLGSLAKDHKEVITP
jgi:hypothetical protein